MRFRRKQISRRQYMLLLGACFLLAFSVRFLLIRDIADAEFDFARIMRPDTASYLQAAQSLAKNGTYSTGIDSMIPETQRPPGYPLLLALCLRLCGDCDGTLKLIAALGCFIGALTTLPVAACGRVLFGRTTGIIAGLFFALNLTAIAAAPMFLADNLLGLLCAGQTFFLLRCLRTPKLHTFFAGVLCAVCAVYVKPVNQPFALILLPFVLAPVLFRTWKTRAYAMLGALGIFAVAVCPWMARNLHCGAGFTIDSNSGLTALHNSAAILAHADRRNGDEVRHDLEIAAGHEFAANPKAYASIRAKNGYYIRLYRDAIREHPGSFIATHFMQVWILLPDLPSYLECLGQTTGGRGTLAVLRKDGPIAAIRHYFGGTDADPVSAGIGYILALSAGILYCAAAGILWTACRKKRFRFLVLFACLVLYYLMIPGPVLMPRYQIPALPLLCASAGAFLCVILPIWHKK